MKITDGLHGFIWESMVENNCNTFLIDGDKKVLIDPGHRHLFDHVERGLAAIGIDLADIHTVLVTHPHPDHLEAVQVFADLPAQFALHEDAWTVLIAMGSRLKAVMGMEIGDVQPDFLLREGDLRIGDLQFRIIDAPGHAPGSAAVYWAEKKALFTGDVIFPNGLGRTDLPGGHGGQLKESIRRLSEFDAEFLCAGHGDVIRGAAAVKDNFKEVMTYWFQYI